MKKNVINFMSCIALFTSFSFANAGSNNGYTSAANVYSGSSSRSWFGGGVDYVLGEWKKGKEENNNVVEETAPTNVEESAPKVVEETVLTNVEETAPKVVEETAPTNVEESVPIDVEMPLEQAPAVTN